jgi:hypothetical protein
LGIVRLLMGDTQGALADFKLESDEEYQLKGEVLCSYAAGDLETFESQLAELRRLYGEQWPSEIAHVYAWTGNPDAAFEWLNKALAIREAGIINSRQVSLLDPLHSDPRWQAFIEQLGVSDAQLAKVQADLKQLSDS